MRYQITYTGKDKRGLIVSETEKLMFVGGKTLECSELARDMVSMLPDKIQEKFIIEPIKPVKEEKIDSRYVSGEEIPKDKKQRDVLDHDKPKRTLANVIDDKRRGTGRKQFHYATGG